MAGFADSVQTWDTYELAAFQRDDRAAPPDSFWMQWFAQPFFSEKKTIVFDDLPVRDRRMAPFVMPHAQARIMAAPGPVGLKDFEPAYVKPAHHIDPSMTIPRMPGEALGGSISRQERFDRITADRIVRQRDMIERRWDWMAAQALIKGSVLVQGEDYMPVTLNFNRDPSLTFILTGSGQWGETGVSPIATIIAARTAAYELGESPINDVVCGTEAAGLFLKDPALKEMNDLRYLPQYSGGPSQFAGRPDFNLTGFGTGSPVEQFGAYGLPDGGTVRFWKYKNSYRDPYTGAMVDLLDPKEVVGIGGAVGGVRCFGAIENFEAGLAATDMFQSMWIEKNPSRAFVATESAPLMVPTNPNNTFRIRVRA